MFKSILVPLDLADTDLARPAIATAATLSQTWNGSVRLLNVLPMTHRPAMRTYFLGSNAGHVVRYAKCSVLVVRH
jgi:nucleotide-binding universal stress UspA family protein